MDQSLCKVSCIIWLWVVFFQRVGDCAGCRLLCLHRLALCLKRNEGHTKLSPTFNPRPNIPFVPRNCSVFCVLCWTVVQASPSYLPVSYIIPRDQITWDRLFTPDLNRALDLSPGPEVELLQQCRRSVLGSGGDLSFCSGNREDPFQTRWPCLSSAPKAPCWAASHFFNCLWLCLLTFSVMLVFYPASYVLCESDVGAATGGRDRVSTERGCKTPVRGNQCHPR